MFYLYLLSSNIDNNFYIGITNNPKRRFKQHTTYSCKKKYHSSYWIEKVKREGGEISMKILLEGLSQEMAVKCEINFISLFKKLNFKLTNISDGGLGFNHKGIPHSEEHKRNIEKGQPHKVRIPKDILYDLYVNKKLSKKSIGKMYGCGATTIDRRLHEYRIEIRVTKNYKMSYKFDNEEIISSYKSENISILQLSKKYNVSANCIRDIFIKNGVNIERVSKRSKKRYDSVSEEFIEKLKYLYLEMKLKQKEIAKILNLSVSYICQLIGWHIKTTL